MAGADYDGIGGVMRLLAAGEKPDTFAIEVITYHAVIEQELEKVIAALVPHPDDLFTTSPKMSFGHKANLLRAVWARDPAQAAILNEVLHRLQDVRNAVAHSDPKAIKSCMAGLANAYRSIDDQTGDEVDILTVTQGICLFLQDGSNTSEFIAMMDGLGELVNVSLPDAIGRRPRLV